MTKSIEPERLDMGSMNIVEEQKLKLRQLFPHVFNEGKIDFEKLRQTLGDDVDVGMERFGMNWPGKAECMKIIQQTSVGTLKPCRDDSVSFNQSENLFIEGDNFEVLKLLQRSYYSKIRMIYIDPPYNTGKNFIYPDKYSETLDTYLAYSNQVDIKGKKFSTNTEADGRFHSNWLNMMHPRLFLARNLLKNDGVIFISIDDNEVGNLRALCDIIFGEENFVSNIIWQKNYSPRNDAKYFSDMHDHILCYAKNKSIWMRNLLPRTEEQNKRYSNRDNDPRGPWKAENLAAKRYTPKDIYAIETPSGRTVYPPKGSSWRVSNEKFSKLVEDNRIWFGENGDNVPAKKSFLSEVQQGRVPVTIWFRDEVGDNQEASNELIELLGSRIFETPKPSRLIYRMLELTAKDNEENIILDFFAGSGTLAHSVFTFNKTKNMNCKFICVQLPEYCDEESEAFKAGYRSVTDIGKERIRKVIEQMEPQKTEQNLDLGFKVFRLDKSNFNIWDGSIDEGTEDEITKQLKLVIDHVNPDSSEEDILYELILKSGFPLTTKIDMIVLADKNVYSIEDDALLICLDRELTKEVIAEMAKKEPARVICLDDGFFDNDQLKTNAVQIMRSFGVEDFRTV